MRKPQSPPDVDRIWDKIKCEPQKIRQYFEKISNLPRNVKYLHWDKLRRLSPPPSMTHEEWWFATKLQRKPSYRKLPLCDKNDSPFVMLLEVDPIAERLHEIDLGSGGLIQMPDQITNPETRDQYYISSLIEEAIASHQSQCCLSDSAI